MQKLLVICGATATGKTALGVYMAKLFVGEIISADSRHVYKGLDIISGKDIPQDVPVWLNDLVSVTEDCSVSLYQAAAVHAIQTIQNHDALPIVVGGTGLYISSLIRPYDTIQIPRNMPLRTKLEKEDVPELAKHLYEIDAKKFSSMNHSDLHNPRRLIRAIEVGEWKLHHKKIPTLVPSFDVLSIGLSCDEDILKERIHKRVIERIDGGALEEATRLENVLEVHMPAFSTLGFSQLLQYLHHEVTKEALVAEWTRREYAYAKRQTRWFRKEKNIVWFDIHTSNNFAAIEKLVREWYTKKYYDN
ncbi:MAG: tRNA (adenosine(37)-N6)-dimethylallyltransferase MiaA [Patescibacteria group bacterium]